jgi:hypothetical protein
MPIVAPNLLPIVRAQLAEEERLAWAETPEPVAFEPVARRKSKWDALAILGGGYATVGSIWMALRNAQWFWLIVPIVLVALGVLVYLASERRKANQLRSIEGTVYVLSTRRVLVLQTFPAFSLQQELAVASITDVSVGGTRAGFSDIKLTSDKGVLVFRGLSDAERAHKQIARIVKDPATAEQEIAASERYMQAMRQFSRTAL